MKIRKNKSAISRFKRSIICDELGLDETLIHKNEYRGNIIATEDIVCKGIEMFSDCPPGDSTTHYIFYQLNMLEITKIYNFHTASVLDNWMDDHTFKIMKKYNVHIISPDTWRRKVKNFFTGSSKLVLITVIVVSIMSIFMTIFIHNHFNVN